MQWRTLINVVLITASLFCIIAGPADSLFLNDRIKIQLFIKLDCNFITPDGYSIVEWNSMYAVRYGEDKFLCEGKYGTTLYHDTISEPSLMYSVCKAKGYLKAYLKEMEPKIKDYKIVE